MWGGIFSVFKIGAGLWTARQERKAVRLARQDRIEEARVNRQIALIESDADKASDLDMYFAKNSGTKQTLSFAMLLVPVFGAFVPGMTGYIEQGFEALDRLPDWYKWAIGMMFIAVWGFRRLAWAILQRRISQLTGGGK